MKPSYSFYLLSVVVALVQPLALQAGGEPAEETVPSSSKRSYPAWSELHFEADSIAGSVNTTLILSEQSVQALNVPPYTALENVEFQFVPHALKLLEVRGKVKTLVGRGSETRGKIWFDAQTGAVLQRDRIRPGKKGVRKIYRFAGNGALRFRLEPEGRNEASGSPDNWTRIKESFYPYDLAGTGCRFVSDPALLLYFVSLADFPLRGEKRSYCMFFDDALYEVHLEPAGTESLELNYTVRKQGSDSRVEGKRDVAGLALRIKPLTKGADTEDFELLELRGDIKLYVDEVTRLPVQIRGQRRGIGELSIRLQNAVVRGSS